MRVQQLEEQSGSALVQSLGELSDGRGHLHAVKQDLALTLQADITRPAHVTGEVHLGGSTDTQTEVHGALLGHIVNRTPGGVLLACGNLLHTSGGGGGGSGLLSGGLRAHFFLATFHSNQNTHLSVSRRISLSSLLFLLSHSSSLLPRFVWFKISPSDLAPPFSFLLPLLLLLLSAFAPSYYQYHRLYLPAYSR